MNAHASLHPLEPNIPYDPATDAWCVRERFLVSDHLTRRRFVVAEGFACDGASIPRAAWRVVGKHELGEPAPTCHDWLYRGHDERYTRAEADRLFLEIMRLDGVPEWRARAAYTAVRLFGGRSWRKGHA